MDGTNIFTQEFGEELKSQPSCIIGVCGEGPRSRSYGRTTALRLIVHPCDEDDQFFSFFQVMEHR
jgi:hypothetical protein